MSKIKIKRQIPIAYPSSLIQQGYGESVTKHGFLFWDIEQRAFEEHDIDTSYGFYKFAVNSVEDVDNGVEKLVNP